MDSFDQDWFDQLGNFRVSFMRQLHIPVPTIFDIKNAEDISSLFTYPSLKSDNALLLNQLTIFLNEIKNNTKKPIQVKRLWEEKITELINLTNLLFAIYKANFLDFLSKEEFEIAKAVSSFAGIQVEIFKLTLAESKLRIFTNGESHGIIFPEKSYDSYAKNFNKVKFADGSFQRVHADSRVSSLDFKILLEQTLLSHNLIEWRVRFDRKNRFGRVVVLGRKKLIILPYDPYNNITFSEVKTLRLIAHEVNTHALRSHNGFLTKLQLLSNGLAYYQKGEEGIATYNEQKAVSDNKYYAGFVSHLAVGLASGADRNFLARNPFEFYELFCQIFSNLGLSEEDSKVKSLQRVFRTYIKLGDTYIINFHDVIYREGNIEIHNLVHESPESTKYFSVGKFNPCNKDQLRLLQELGIII